MLTLFAFTIGLSLIAAAPGGQDSPPLRFDTADHGDPGDKAPILKPWKSIEIDPEYGGHWRVYGDVDGDGAVEVVSCRNVDEDDVHYTSTAVVQRLDGSVLWRWGDPTIGRTNLHHDVACQIYDWDGDGKNEVVLLTEGFLVELDGATGKERRRFPIPPEATDCLAFVNLSGGERATDVLVKTRYSQIWAYNYDGKLLWTVENPGGYRTAHQAIPIDIDGDGKDEIMAGYALLNPGWHGSLAVRIGKGGYQSRPPGLLSSASKRREAGRLEACAHLLWCQQHCHDRWQRQGDLGSHRAPF